ncbi:hypothetical protein AB0H77_33930 [Streptomyces sp. NPDC050844]
MAVRIPHLYVTRSATWVSYAVERFDGGSLRSGVLALNGADPEGRRP